jgi:dihydroorotate dehydrogenase electron transfer subunit
VSQAPIERRRLRVAGNDEVGSYRVLRLTDPDGPPPAGPTSSLGVCPGQFSMLSAVQRWGGGEDERPFLPRAFSVMRVRDGEAHYLLEDVGPGTNRLCELAAGDEVWVLGPLGQGFRAPREERRAVLVGGGVGIAPLAIWQDALLERGAPHALLLGFRDGDHAIGANLLRCARVATDDGSLGHHGYVTELLAAELEENAHAEIYACGPPLMLEAVRALCEERGVPSQLALESGMACGFGACFGCVVPTRDGGYLRVCVDGPVVEGALLAEVEAHAGSPA